MVLVNPAGVVTAEGFGSLTLQPRVEWWSRRFPFRRRVLVEAPDEPLPERHPIDVDLSLAVMLDQGKTRTDFADVEVAYFDGAQWQWLSRAVTELEDVMQVRFLLWEEIQSGGVGEYCIYYGAPSSTGLGRPVWADNLWPIVVSHDAGRIGFTRPTEHWRDGVSDVRGAKATLEFVGVAARVMSRVGPDRGIAEVQIDEGLWEDVDLFAPAAADTEVFAAYDLEPGPHKLRVRVTGRANPNATGSEVNVVQMAYVTQLLVVPQPEEIDADQWGGGGLGGG